MQKQSGPYQLIYLFSKLPGLGNRSARRMARLLLQNKDLRLNGLIKGRLMLQKHKLMIANYVVILTIQKYALICSDTSRTDSIIAVVETVAEALGD